jgi:serine/threonine protein kinase
VPPTAADRVIADVTLGERLSVGLYGELHRARRAGSRDVRALVVDPRLVADTVFAAALAENAPALIAFHHPGVVGTLAVTVEASDAVVVTEAVTGPVSLHDLLGDLRPQGGKVAPRLAAAIARSVIDGVAAAHAAGIVHGALHPRSVLIDVDGTVKLADFAVGRALTRAVARGADASLARGLAGFLAPEIALGDEPGPAADVFAVGALLFLALTGELPPGSLGQTPAIERLIQRALDGDLARRFANAIELQENLAEALEDDGWAVATPAEIARFAGASRTTAEANLDDATEDLLASLGDAMKDPPTRRNATPVPVADRPRTGGDLDAVFAGLDDEHTGTGAGSGTHTDVDLRQRGGQTARDPISELLSFVDSGPTRVNQRPGSRPRAISLDERSDPTPLPPPRADETLTRDHADIIAGRRRPGKATAEAQALAAIEDLEARPSKPALPAPPPTLPPVRAVRTAVPAPFLVPEEAPSLARRLGWVWILLAAAGLGALVWVVTSQADRNREAEARRAAAQQRAAAETARLTDELPDPGAIRVDSSPRDAAVWLLLGRTPMTSFALPTGMVHQVRVELEGFRPVDRNVVASDWTGGGAARVAALEVALAAQGAGKPLPALPPAPSAAAQQGLTDGRGTIAVTSKPAGAAVWLLVGVTGNMNLGGIEAGRDYELRVSKDGYVPGYVRITAEEWRSGGDPRLPLSAAPKKATIEKVVDLVREPRRGK